MKNPQFNLGHFSEINLERCNSPLGFNAGDKTLTYFASGLAEETGEVAGILKRLERGFNQRELKKIKNKYVKLIQNDRAMTESEAKLMISSVTHLEWEFRWRKGLEEKLSLELADVFSYLDLIATKAGNIDLFQAVRGKFNQVSEDMGCEQFKI